MGNYKPNPNECPDGSIMIDEASRIQRWGHSHGNYYSMKVTYFMSSLGSQLLQTMSKKSLWIRVLSTTSMMEAENRNSYAERLKKTAEKLSAVDSATSQSGGGGMGGGMAMMMMQGHGKRGRGGAGGPLSLVNDDLQQQADACDQLAIEQCKGHASQIAKDLIFNLIQRQAEREKQQQQ